MINNIQKRSKTLNESCRNHSMAGGFFIVFGILYIIICNTQSEYSITSKLLDTDQCSKLESNGTITGYLLLIFGCLTLFLSILFFIARKQDFLEKSCGLVEFIGMIILAITLALIITQLFSFQQECSQIEYLYYAYIVFFLLFAASYYFLIFKDKHVNEQELFELDKVIQEGQELQNFG